MNEYRGPWLVKIQAAMCRQFQVSGDGTAFEPEPVKGGSGDVKENGEPRSLTDLMDDNGTVAGLLEGARVGFILAAVFWAVAFVAWWKLWPIVRGLIL